MCKSKEEFPPFGKVCDVHNNGNKATIEMCSQITGVASEKVNAVFNDLRKEGKGLPEPSQEEVKEYASSQVFIAKYDPKIQDKSRNRIVNWWRKARDTQPSGGLMHAWKNTLPQTLARYRRTTLASVAMFSIALTSACGSTPPQNNNENTSSPIATTAPATPSEEATVKPTETTKPSPTQDNSVAGKSINKLKAQGVTIGDTVKVKGGSYPQYEVDESSHLAKFEPSKHTGGTPKGWKKSDLQKSQIAASNYMTNLVLDNPTTNDYESNKKQFANLTKDASSSKVSQEFYNAVINKDAPFLQDTLQDKGFNGDKSKGFRFVSDGKTPRIADLSDLQVESSQNWDGGVYYQYGGDVTMNVVDKDKKPYTMDFKVSFGMTVLKEKDDYKIFGLHNLDTKYQNPTPAN